MTRLGPEAARLPRGLRPNPGGCAPIAPIAPPPALLPGRLGKQGRPKIPAVVARPPRALDTDPSPETRTARRTWSVGASVQSQLAASARRGVARSFYTRGCGYRRIHFYTRSFYTRSFHARRRPLLPSPQQRQSARPNPSRTWATLAIPQQSAKMRCACTSS